MRNDSFATDEKIREVLQPGTDYTAGGPVLYYRSGAYWKYTGEGSLVFLGVTGCGKSRGGTIPLTRSLIDAHESFVVNDPKGEIYAATAPALPEDYKVRVIDLRHMHQSPCFNPLAAPAEFYKTGDLEKRQKAYEMFDDLSHTLYPPSIGDPFWILSARDVFLGAAYALLDCAQEEEITINSIYEVIARGEERCGPTTYLKKLLASLPKNSLAERLLHSYITTANETRGGIRSTFLEGISVFAKSEGMVALTAHDDLHINELDGETPTAIFIIKPDETPIYDTFCGVTISQLMFHFTRLAHEKYNGKLPRRMNFIVEETGNCGRIGSLPHVMAAGRSRNIRCHLVFQSFSQLDALYGKATASAIRSNADVLVAYRTNNWETLTELSRKCGERMVEENGVSRAEPLITASQLASMQTGQALVMISGRTRFVSQLPDYTELFGCRSAEAPVRAKRPDHPEPKTFDIRAYVRRLDEQEQEEEPMRERSGFPSPHPGFLGEEKDLPPFLHGAVHRPPQNMDEYIAMLDRKIAELEAQEAAEREAQEKPFFFELRGYCKRKTDLIGAIHQKTDTQTVKKAKEIVQNLPYTFRFKTREEMLDAMHGLMEAGGLITPPTEPEENEEKFPPLPPELEELEELEEPELYSVVLVEVPPDRRVDVCRALQNITKASLPDARKLLNELPYPLEFDDDKEKAQRAAKMLQDAGAVIFPLGFELD